MGCAVKVNKKNMAFISFLSELYKNLKAFSFFLIILLTTNYFVYSGGERSPVDFLLRERVGMMLLSLLRLPPLAPLLSLLSVLASLFPVPASALPSTALTSSS